MINSHTYGLTEAFFFKHWFISCILHIILPLISVYLFNSYSLQSKISNTSWVLNFDGMHYWFNFYRFEPNFAFLPLYPSFLHILRVCFQQNIALFLAVALNKCLIFFAAKDLYSIISLITNDHLKSKTVVILFYYNPASIFFHSVYTQSLFCFLTFKAIKSALEYQGISIQAIILLSLSTFLRSNSIFLSPVIGLSILYEFFNSICKPSLKCFGFLIKGFISLCFIVGPFISYLIFGFIKICQSQSQFHTLPNIYSYVQARFWNVGFFSYYNLSNIVFIIIGFPAILVGFYCLSCFKKTWSIYIKGLYMSYVFLLIMIVSMTNIQSATRFLSTHPIFYLGVGQIQKIIIIWVIFYCLLGNFMYPLGFPWT